MPEKLPRPGALNPERTKFAAIAQGRCPRCRTGKLFKYESWAFNKATEMNKECSNCKQDFVIEPGFYWGAMYVSYAINVATIVTCMVIYFLFFSEASEFYLIGTIVVLIALLIPVNFRLGRILMIHLFSGIKYDRRYVNSVNVEQLDVDFRKRNPQ